MVQAVLGFDVGGTKTQCAVMTMDGRVVGTGQAGPGNFHLVGARQFVRVIAQAAREALQQANEPVQVIAAFVGAAGATAEQEQRHIAEVCQQANLAPKWYVMGDMVPALAAGTRGKEGIVVIAGTGAICWGYDVQGQSARASGWGYLLGDEGSGFAIAQRGLNSAFRAYDGRGQSTSLGNRLRHALRCNTMSDIVRIVYEQKNPRSWLASLAPIVLQAAEQGDTVANDIVDEAATHHVHAIRAVYRQLQFINGVTVVAAGGLFEKSDVLFQRLRVALQQFVPEARLVVPNVSPAVGACYMAQRLVQGDTLLFKTAEQ